MQIQKVSIKSLSYDPENARKHDEKNIEAIKSSLRKFKQRKPIVVRNNVVIAGNGTLRAALELGWSDIIIARADDMSEQDARAFAIADNQSALLAEWDMPILGKQLLALQEDGFDLNEVGFDPDDLDLDEFREDETGGGSGQIPDDEIPQVEENIFGVKRGDIWQLGEHRLMCGDSTSKEDVDRLMAGEKADMVFTSPPYGQQRDYGEAKELVKDWDMLMNGVFSALPASSSCQVFVNLGLIHRNNEWQPYWNDWLEAMRNYGWRKFGWYIWDQGSGLPGDWNGRLAPSFEFIFHFNTETSKPIKTVKKKDSSGPMGSNLRSKDGENKVRSSICTDENKILDSVIRVNRNSSHGTGHPATFPVELPYKFLEAWNGDCYEPFCGSGSTLIACEKTSRKCYGMEIDPHYCSVIIKRFQDYSGKEAKKLTAPAV